MKKLTSLALSALLILSIGNNVLAQDAPAAENSTATKTTGNRPNARVLASFSALFAGISDAGWCPTDNGFMARFTQSGIQHFAYFTKKGKLESLIRYYHEKDLPAAIGQQIKEAYRPDSIASVKEVTHGGATAYLVTIDFGASWQIIRYAGGEMDVWEAHQKG